MIDVGIVGVGTYLPEKTMKAAEIAGLTNGVWSEDAVINKLGIKQRYLPGPDDGTQEMGAKAALKCLENTGVDPKEIDVILCIGEEWKEYPLTTSACYIQDRIGATNAWGIDVQNRCCTCVSAMKIAADMLRADDEINTIMICGGYRVVANANARQHGGVRAYPHVFSYHDGRRLHTFPTLGIQVVIECCKHNLMTDQSAVAYGYAALVLKTASGIYEHVFAYRYVFAAVGVKGRKQQKRFVCFFANQPEKQFAYFFGRKIFSVYFRRNFLRVASQNMHTSVRVGVCGDIRIFFDKFNVFFCIHIFKSFNLFYV